MKSALNHVAILVESIESVLEKNNFSSDLLGEIEEFPSEGTRELYIGLGHQTSRLLLMQAMGEGPYKRALEKRGAGLHHIALDVLDIDAYLEDLSGSGWLLHPKSLHFYKNNRQVYLSRPGIPALIEVQERKALVEENYFIEELQFPFAQKRLMEALKCEKLKMNSEMKIKIKAKFLSVEELI